MQNLSKYSKGLRKILAHSIVFSMVFSLTAGNAHARVAFENYRLDVNSHELVLDADNDNPTGFVTLQLGNDGTDAALIYDTTTQDLNVTTPGGDVDFGSNDISTTGDITANNITANVTVDANGIIFLGALAGEPGTCTEGEAYYSTATHKFFFCTATNTWSNSGPQDFEAVYATDTGNDLNTSNGAFNITTGTADFTISSADWSVNGFGVIEGAEIHSRGNFLNIDSDNTGPGASVQIIANQGSDPDGRIQYTAGTDTWEIDNGTGTFDPIVTGAGVRNTFDNVFETSRVDGNLTMEIDSGGTLAFDIDGTAGTGFKVQRVGTDLMSFTNAGAVSITPISDQDLSLTTAGTGNVDLTSASAVTVGAAAFQVTASSAIDLHGTSGGELHLNNLGATLQATGGTNGVTIHGDAGGVSIYGDSGELLLDSTAWGIDGTGLATGLSFNDLSTQGYLTTLSNYTDGAGAPVGSCATENEFYYDTTGNDWYQCISSAWVLKTYGDFTSEFGANGILSGGNFTIETTQDDLNLNSTGGIYIDSTGTKGVNLDSTGGGNLTLTKDGHSLVLGSTVALNSSSNMSLGASGAISMTAGGSTLGVNPLGVTVGGTIGDSTHSNWTIDSTGLATGLSFNDLSTQGYLTTLSNYTDGAGAPVGSCATENEFYYDTTGNDWYQCISSAWVLKTYGDFTSEFGANGILSGGHFTIETTQDDLNLNSTGGIFLNAAGSQGLSLSSNSGDFTLDHGPDYLRMESTGVDLHSNTSTDLTANSSINLTTFGNTLTVNPGGISVNTDFGDSGTNWNVTSGGDITSSGKIALGAAIDPNSKVRIVDTGGTTTNMIYITGSKPSASSGAKNGLLSLISNNNGSNAFGGELQATVNNSTAGDGLAVGFNATATNNDTGPNADARGLASTASTINGESFGLRALATESGTGTAIGVYGEGGTMGAQFKRTATGTTDVDIATSTFSVDADGAGRFGFDGTNDVLLGNASYSVDADGDIRTDGTISSTGWSIASDGTATGLSFGSLAADSFTPNSFGNVINHPSGTATPGTCTVDDTFYDTDDDILYYCTATNVWTAQPAQTTTLYRDGFESSDTLALVVSANTTEDVAAGIIAVNDGTGAADAIVTAVNDVTINPILGEYALKQGFDTAAENRILVDTSGNIAVTPDADADFTVTTTGASGGISFSTGTWDITEAGAGTGFTVLEADDVQIDAVSLESTGGAGKIGVAGGYTNISGSTAEALFSSIDSVLDGIGSTTKYEWLDIGGGVRNSAVLGTINSGATPAISFDGTDASSVVYSFPVPADWQSGTGITVSVYYSPSNTNGGVVDFLPTAQALATGEVPGGSNIVLSDSGQTITASTEDTIYEYQANLSAAGIASDDMITFRLARNPGVGSDTYSGDAHIHMIRVEYTGLQ